MTERETKTSKDDSYSQSSWKHACCSRCPLFGNQSPRLPLSRVFICSSGGLEMFGFTSSKLQLETWKGQLKWEPAMIPSVRQEACSRRAPVKLQPCTDGFSSAKVKWAIISILELAVRLQVRLLKVHCLHPWFCRGICFLLTSACSCAVLLTRVKSQLWRFTKNWILPNTGGFLPTSSPPFQLCSEPFCFLCYLLHFPAFSIVLSKFHWSRLP